MPRNGKASKARNGIVWEDPPPLPERYGTGVWLKRLEPLKAHKGRWARVCQLGSRNSANSVASRLRTGTFLRKPPGRWEFASRERFVYAKYLGR